MVQTRFETVQSGLTIARELTLDEAGRAIRGETFTVSLKAEIPFQHDVQKPLDIIVDRIQSDTEAMFPNLANGDRIVATTARREPSGDSFHISILFHLELMRDQGALVYVSRDMEAILLEELQRDLNEPPALAE